MISMPNYSAWAMISLYRRGRNLMLLNSTHPWPAFVIIMVWPIWTDFFISLITWVSKDSSYRGLKCKLLYLINDDFWELASDAFKHDLILERLKKGGTH